MTVLSQKFQERCRLQELFMLVADQPSEALVKIELVKRSQLLPHVFHQKFMAAEVYQQVLQLSLSLQRQGSH